MSKRFIATFVCSILGLIGASGFALAETIGRYECSIIGTAGQDSVGDPNGHVLVSVQYSCFGVDGLLKGAVHTASSISEFDRHQGTFLLGGGVHRAPGGLAVTQITEGTGSHCHERRQTCRHRLLGKRCVQVCFGYLGCALRKSFQIRQQADRRSSV